MLNASTKPGPLLGRDGEPLFSEPWQAQIVAMADAAGVECLLVGDSLGMVCQGLPSTVAVSLATMCYHTESVARGLRRAQGTAWIVGDMPFGSYQESREQALKSAVALLQAGAHMVKLEGGGWTTETVRFLVERGIPVCAHLGLTPQTVHALGGYRVQGRGDEAGALLRHACAGLQVPAGAEETAGGSENGDAQAGIVTKIGKHLAHLPAGRRIDRIGLRPVERDLQNGAIAGDVERGGVHWGIFPSMVIW